jgi:plastocyanin
MPAPTLARRSVPLAACLLLAATFPAHAGPARAPRRPAGHTVRVSMEHFVYAPASVTVHVGDAVRWTYDEKPTSVPAGCEFPGFQTPTVMCPGHSVTSVAQHAGHPLFDSKVHRAQGFPFAFRFTHPGTYNYFCTVHGGPHPNSPATAMNGTITVK